MNRRQPRPVSPARVDAGTESCVPSATLVYGMEECPGFELSGSGSTVSSAFYNHWPGSE